MTPPDEVVCESEARFIYEVRKHVDYHPGGKVMPGDSVTVGGRTIVYRPKPPPLSRPLCPRCGKAMTRVRVALNIEAWECENDGRFHKYDGDPPPPPRDEAREAFDGLYGDRIFTTEYHKKDVYDAFLAGRASVKPTYAAYNVGAEKKP